MEAVNRQWQDRAREIRENAWMGTANKDADGRLLYPQAIVRVTKKNIHIPVGEHVRLVALIGAAWVVELADGERASLVGNNCKLLRESPEGELFASSLDHEYQMRWAKPFVEVEVE